MLARGRGIQKPCWHGFLKSPARISKLSDASLCYPAISFRPSSEAEPKTGTRN